MATSENTCKKPSAKKGVQQMKASHFEDQALNNISPLPMHLFDVPKTETRPISSAIFVLPSLWGHLHAEVCSDYSVLLCFLFFFLKHARYQLLVMVMFPFRVGVTMYLEDLMESDGSPPFRCYWLRLVLISCEHKQVRELSNWST